MNGEQRRPNFEPTGQRPRGSRRATPAELDELIELLRPHMSPVESHEGQTLDQALNWEAYSYSYIAWLYLDYDGPLGEPEIEHIRRELVRITALG